jgi:hypothetical protein
MESITFNGSFSDAVGVTKRGVTLFCPRCGARLLVKDGKELGAELPIAPGVSCSADPQHFRINAYLSDTARRFREHFSKRKK